MLGLLERDRQQRSITTALKPRSPRPGFLAHRASPRFSGSPYSTDPWLATRCAAIALFIFDIFVVISCPALNAVGLKDHTYWGLMLLVWIFHGPGKLSIDQLLQFLSNKACDGCVTSA